MKTLATTLGLAVLTALLVTACDRTPTDPLGNKQINGLGLSEHTGGLTGVEVDHETCGGFIPENPGVGCPDNDGD